MRKKPWICGRVEVHGHNPVGARGLEQVGDETGGDRYARFVLFVGPGIGVVGQHRRDSAGARMLDGIDHDEELHDPLVYRRARRLDDIDILATDAFGDFDLDILIRELDYFASSKLDLRAAADRFRKRDIGIPRKNLQLVIHGSKVLFPCRLCGIDYYRVTRTAIRQYGRGMTGNLHRFAPTLRWFLAAAAIRHPIRARYPSWFPR